MAEAMLEARKIWSLAILLDPRFAVDYLENDPLIDILSPF